MYINISFSVVTSLKKFFDNPFIPKNQTKTNRIKQKREVIENYLI